MILPNKTAKFRINISETISYSVFYKNKAIILDSPFSLEFAHSAPYEEDFIVKDKTYNEINENMSNFTRREILKILSMIFPATIFGCNKKDVFDQERVCVHIFQTGFHIPRPLLHEYKKVPQRSSLKKLFKVGIPELILCTTSASFLPMFQYFWPVTREEFQIIPQFISVLFQRPEITEKSDLVNLSKYSENHFNEFKIEGINTALIFTFNDYTKYFISEILDIWRVYGIDEFVLFKDPTRSPYLCDYPSLQKGFKRSIK